MIALAACTHAPATTPAPAAPGVISNVAPGATPTHEPLATIERSGCFGWCPIYEATVFATAWSSTAVESELDRLVHIEKGIGTEAEREKLSGR